MYDTDIGQDTQPGSVKLPKIKAGQSLQLYEKSNFQSWDSLEKIHYPKNAQQSEKKLLNI